MDTLNQIPNPNVPQVPVNSLNPMTLPSNKMRNIVLIVMAVVLGVIYLPREIMNPGVITVTGTGKMSVTPESVSLIVTRVNTSLDSTTAITNGNDGLNTLINEVKNVVGEEVEIQKSFYSTTSVSSQGVINGQTTLVKGLQVTNGFKVTFKDISKTNDLIRNLYNSGATSVSNISFIPANKDIVEQEVRKLAIDNAKSEAQKITKLLGKRVGRIASIGDDQSEVGSSVGSGQNIVGADKVDITKTVSVVYEIW